MFRAVVCLALFLTLRLPALASAADAQDSSSQRIDVFIVKLGSGKFQEREPRKGIGSDRRRR